MLWIGFAVTNPTVEKVLGLSYIILESDSFRLGLQTLL